jgi:hypothetical protein
MEQINGICQKKVVILEKSWGFSLEWELSGNWGQAEPTPDPPQAFFFNSLQLSQRSFVS